MRNSDPDTALPGFERSLAVVIGINSYSHGIPPLLNAVRDANAVADSLERQGFEVLRLLDSQASLSALSQFLSHHLPSLPSPPDRLLIYFAGHGLAHTDEHHQLSGFLLPADARRDDTSSYWPMAALRESLRHLPCRHLLLILDCCFAGAFPHSPSRDIRAPSLPAPLYLERFRHFSSRRSFQLLLSTAHDELASDRLLAKPAQESLGDGLHSPFALALLQGLEPSSPADSNQDGLLTAAELYTFLRDRLLSLVPSHCQQTPSLWHLDWHDGGEFLFLLSDSFPSLPPAAPLSQHSNPYLGLRPFSSAHRHLFFGRERLVDSLLERLRTQPLLLLCGPSGAGKSSLVHAGLLPRLAEDTSWLVPPSLRPSSQPLHALSSWLASLAPNTVAPSAAVLASRPRSAAEFLGSFLARHPERSVLLVIDPLEELVTACLDDSLRRAFLRALSGLLQLSHPRLRLLLLLRSDFEPHFLSLLQSSAIASELWHGSRLNLPPMNRDELRRCIEKPAEACVLFFSPGLIERLLDDVEQMPGTLPLLSVALSELFGAYLASGRDDRTLCFEDYHHIGGGIAGALQRRAELVFSGTPLPSTEGQPALPPIALSELPAFQRTLRNVLLRMVSPEGGELARRRVSRSELVYPHREENARVQRALRTLEASRLVVASDDGGPCVEPAHDALLSAWPRLHDWARHAQRELLLLRRVSHAASEWHRHRHTADFLWADARLDQLGLALTSLRRSDVPLALPTASPGGQSTEPLALNATESAFLRASATRRRFLRTRRNTLTLTVAVMLVALTVAALFQANKATANAGEAQRQKVAAETNEQEARKQKGTAEANERKAQEQQQLAEHNAKEAQLQQAAAETNLKEARKQQQAANANATEAQRQKDAAEFNANEARKQQQLAETNAREALAQKNTADVNAKEAQRQKEAADANAWEIQRQQQLAETNAKEALHQKYISEANAQEARKQQETAEANAREAKQQQAVAETNAQEARKQQNAAEANFEEARKQQEIADANAKEAQRQQEAAEANAREARKQQQLADVNAREALAQRNTAEANAREARRQQDAAEISSKEAQKQKNLALTSARLKNVERLLEEDPTKALLAILAGGSWLDYPGNPWLQAALDISQRAIDNGRILSRSIFIGHSGRLSPDGSRVLTISEEGTVHIWSANGSSAPIVLGDQTAKVTSATFSSEGSRVLTISSDNIARVWSIDNPGTPIVLEDNVGSANFSPDGSRVLTISSDNSARVWSIDNPGTPIVLEDNVGSANFSPDGSRVLTVSNSDGIARIWSTEKPSPPRSLAGYKGWVSFASFTPDGSHVLTLSVDNGPALLWRTDNSDPPTEFTGHQDFVPFAAFSPDSSRILTISLEGIASTWRIGDAENPIVLDDLDNMSQVTSATFSPDSSRVLTVSNDGIARVWSADSSSTPIVLENQVASATFSPDGSRILTASIDGTARIWRSDGSSLLDVLVGHKLPVSAYFNADGSYVLTASDDGTARVWHIGGSGTFRFDSHTNFESLLNVVTSATLSPDGSRILTGFRDGTVRIQRIEGSGAPVVRKDHTDTVLSATFSPNNSSVLTISFDGTARIWRADNNPDDPIILNGVPPWESSTTFSPDGSHIITASDDGTARIQKIDGSGVPLILKGHTGEVISAMFSPDGSRVLTTSSDGTARLWQMENSKTSIVFDGVDSATFSPDGSRIITFCGNFNCNGNVARIWRTDGSRDPIVLNNVDSAIFSPDSSRVLTISRDSTVRIWRADSPDILMELKGHTGRGELATFSPDGSLVLIIAGDGVTRIWSVDKSEPVFTMQRDGIFRTFFLSDSSHVLTVSSTGIIKVWPIKIDSLRNFLENATSACFSINERQSYLLESIDEAREGHEGCERTHGRRP